MVEKTKKILMGSSWRKALSDAKSQRVPKKTVDTAAVDESKENASMNPVPSSKATAAAGRGIDQTSKSSSSSNVLKHKLPKKPTIEQTIDEEVAKMSMEMSNTHFSEAAHDQQQQQISDGNTQKKEKPWPVMTSNAPGLANCSSLPVQSKTIAPSPSFRIPQAASMITKSYSKSSLVSKASAALRPPRTPKSKRSFKAPHIEKEMFAANAANGNAPSWPVMKSGEAQVLSASASLPVQSKSSQNGQMIPQVASMVAKPSSKSAPRFISESAVTPTPTSIVGKPSKGAAYFVSKTKSTVVKTAEPKKAISPINNRYHAEKALQKEEAASVATAAVELVSVKKKTISKNKKRQGQKKSALQQFREEEAAKAKVQARIKADIHIANSKRREEDLKNGRGCLMDGLVCRPQLSLVSEHPETPRRSNATPLYDKGEKAEGFEVNGDKAEGKAGKGKSGGKGDSDQAIIQPTKSNKSLGKKSVTKSSSAKDSVTVIYEHELPSKSKAKESDAVVPSTLSKPLKTKIKAVPKANATPKSKSKSAELETDANTNPSNEKPKMSPRSKARMKRNNLASNSLTEKEADEFPDAAAYPKYACFGSQAIIPDATSEESDMVGDEIVREASQAIGKALNIDPNEVKINIDRVVEDVATSPKGLFGIKKWFDRGESERSRIMPNESIFDGLESVAPMKSKKQPRGICSSALASLVCGTGEQVIVENNEGELRIRNIASVCSDDGEVIMIDDILANETLDDDSEDESDTDFGDETFDVDTDLEEDAAELGFDAYTPVRARASESFDEYSHYETGTDTEESDLDDIIDEDVCSVESETDFDSVSATTSSSAPESLVETDDNNDDDDDNKISEMIDMDSRSSHSRTRRIPERIVVQIPISVNETFTNEESTRSPVKGRKTPLGRLTPSLSSFFKKTGLSTPRSAVPASEKEPEEDVKQIETTASLRSETNNEEADGDDERVAKTCDDKDLKSELSLMMAARGECQVTEDDSCKTESIEEPQLSSRSKTSDEAPAPNDVLRTPSTMSKASAKENHTASTLEESSSNDNGSAITEQISSGTVITEQISLEAVGIEVSFSSNSEKEQSKTSQQQEIASTRQAIEIGHEVDIEDAVACISSTMSQEINTATSNDIEVGLDEGKIEPTVEVPIIVPSMEAIAVYPEPEGASQDLDSIGSQKESRQDAFLPEDAADGCREDKDSAKRLSESGPKREESLNLETEPTLKSSSPLDKDTSFSSRISLDQSTGASSRLSDVLSNTSEGIEIKNPIKGMGHRRRKSRMRSFLMDKIQKPASVHNE